MNKPCSIFRESFVILRNYIEPGPFDVAVAYQVGKRPAEYVDNPNYQIYGGSQDRFITVIDKKTGFVEAFWDNNPQLNGTSIDQLRNERIAPDSIVEYQRKEFYKYLGANMKTHNNR